MLSIPPSSGHWVYDPSDFRGVNWLEHYSSNILEMYRRTKVTVDPSITQGLTKSNQWGPYRYLCSARLGGADLPRAKRLAQWRWAHGDSLMQPLDPEKMATIIRRTPMRFVGDSLMQEMFSSMVGLMRQHVMVDRAWAANGTMVVPLRGGGSIRYESKQQVVKASGATRTHVPEAPDYPILVLDSTMPVAQNNCSAKSDLGRAVSKLFRGLLVVYVAMDPTHPACSTKNMQSAYDRPTTTKPSIANFSKSQLYDYKRWCWNKIPEHTHNDIQSLCAHLGDKVVVINMTDVTGQRPDSHSIKIPYGGSASRCCDCMHHCLPGGPIETWNDALYAVTLNASMVTDSFENNHILNQRSKHSHEIAPQASP